jgi:purine-binding chemotaxis protein CheW
MVITRAPDGREAAIGLGTTATPVMIHSGGIPYLTFSAGHTSYALHIASTKAIVDSPLILSDPCLPDFVKGAIHVEGRLIPVIDLASRVGFPAARPGYRCCVVLVETQLDGKVIELGVEVDHVHDVLDLSAPGMDSPPSCGDNLNTHFVDAMAKRLGHYAMVMHLEQLLFSDELTELAGLGDLSLELVHH